MTFALEAAKCSDLGNTIERTLLTRIQTRDPIIRTTKKAFIVLIEAAHGWLSVVVSTLCCRIRYTNY